MDESKKNFNVQRRFSDNFIIKVPLNVSRRCYFEAYSDFNQFFKKTYLKPELIEFNVSGWEGENLNFRVSTSESDFYMTLNILDKRLNETKISEIIIKENKIKFKFTSSKNSVVFNSSNISVNGTTEVEMPFSKNLEFTLDNIKGKLNLSNAKSQAGFEYCGIPLFINNISNNVNFTIIHNPDFMNGIPSEGKTLFEISEFPESSLEENLNNYDDYDYKNHKTLIFKGYSEKQTDTSEHFIMTSGKYVREDLDFEFSGDYFLVFNSENSGDDFTSYDDAKNHNFISKNKEKIFLLSAELDILPDSLNRASWKRINHFLTCKR